MANSVVTQILADGCRHFTLKVTGILDTSDVAATAIVTPASMASMVSSAGVLPQQVRIDRITWSIQEGLAVRLEWDAATPVQILDLTKTGAQDYRDMGGLQNNAVSPTGNILMATQGFVAASIYNFSFLMECIKQRGI